ncbi:P-loop containing nucleoside triphosphate hydrolase protein [Ephemerocybe angulata]|uniref:P-loop containing nucleoside triphosphate hydrolase protein n=1 Tax=Ephemerocybe angulata TaxID=980116 RepID=A0A8H6HI27_9AGAR|nr:P-loop containing nucleoside triphosphate hydrolase protein [Tulosesus angulatus]
MHETQNKNDNPGVAKSDRNDVGLSDAQLSQPRRRMLDLVNRLHSTGVQVDIDLPQIAVIGSQSAGKSSLIEAISGITLPRAAGTCTRCPTECRLSHSDSPWQCKVSLRFITDKTGQLLGQVRNETFGPVIYNKAEVEDRIKRAQRAILNPSRPRKDFLVSEEDDSLPNEVNFSSNCVSLQISGPGVADLSFCDLPGLIASVSSKGHANDIALVESLVTSYIKKSSCIILLTVTCETDFENQGAHRLAKQYDPEGKRTIGVLTKPDRIPDGEQIHWLPFIRNEREPLDNNWYCVKQPSSSDIKQNITWDDARKREDDYFSMTSPWNELDSIYLKYLRTKNLVDRLSNVLSDLIAKRLPEIQDELDKTIIKTRQALHSLPRPPSSDPVNEIANMLYEFTADLHQHIDGVPGDDGLLQTIRPVQDRFRQAIRGTAPEFIPFERAKAANKRLEPPNFLVGDDEIDVVDPKEYGESLGAARKVVNEALEDEDEVVPEGKGKKTARKRQAEEMSDDAEESRRIYVDEVFARARKARTRELPGNYPFAVQKTFIVDIVKQWKQPALVYLQTVQTFMLAHTKMLVSKHFSEFGQGILEQRVRSIVHNHLKQCFKRAEERVLWVLETEENPFTVNYHYLSDYKSKFLAYYKSARDRETRGEIAAHIEGRATSRSSAPVASGSTTPSRTPGVIVLDTPTPASKKKRVSESESGSSTPAESGMPAVTKALALLAEVGLVGLKPDDLYKMLPADEMEPAIDIMANVRAYFQVAYKRFSDNIPQAVDHELVRGVERDILKTLCTKLGTNGPHSQRNCAELAQESPQIADRRQDLLKKVERLQTATVELMEIGL